MSTPRILVVDDDVDFAESLGEVLESHGCEVVIAHSGESAISIFSEQQFDIAFMDVKMPGLNGVESFFEMRKIRPDVKVMLMTGYALEELLQQAIDQGVLGVLNKPLDIEQVLKVVESALSDGIILLADDDEDFVESVSTTLRDQGYSVLVARDGGEVISLVENNSIDVLILDLKMPVLDGLQVYLQLKEIGRQLPTLIVTGYAEEASEKLKTLRQMTQQGCLIKPFDPQALLDGVYELLEKRR